MLDSCLHCLDIVTKADNRLFLDDEDNIARWSPQVQEGVALIGLSAAMGWVIGLLPNAS